MSFAFEETNISIFCPKKNCAITPSSLFPVLANLITLGINFFFNSVYRNSLNFSCFLKTKRQNLNNAASLLYIRTNCGFSISSRSLFHYPLFGNSCGSKSSTISRHTSFNFVWVKPLLLVSSFGAVYNESFPVYFGRKTCLGSIS